MIATFLSILLQALGVILVVDFVSGLMHWLEDSYEKEDWPVTGYDVTRPNILHHHDPRAFTRCPVWKRNRVTVSLSLVIFLIVAALDRLSWHWWLTLALGVLSNEIHCWAHRTPPENGPIISWLQRHRIIQTPAQHARLHTGSKNRSYCVLTNWLNPLLDRVHLFDHLEAMIFRVFHVSRGPDPSISSH